MNSRRASAAWIVSSPNSVGFYANISGTYKKNQALGVAQRMEVGKGATFTW
jgi:hypothetical protein